VKEVFVVEVLEGTGRDGGITNLCRPKTRDCGRSKCHIVPLADNNIGNIFPNSYI